MCLMGSFPDGLGFRGGSAAKTAPAVQETQETQFRSLGQEDPLEEEMATHSSILSWKVKRSLVGYSLWVAQKELDTTGADYTE